MNDVPRRKLQEIVSRYGREVLYDPRRCRALLLDFCGEYKGEINLLEMALREDVVRDYESSSLHLPQALVLARLSQRLRDAYYLPEDAARWAVEACVSALDGASPAQEDRVFVSQVPATVMARDWLGAADAWQEIGTTPGRVLVAGDVEVGLSARPDASAPDVLSALAADIAAFGPVQQLDLSYGAVTDDALSSLAQVDGLLRLNLSRTTVSDAGLCALAKEHPQLLELNLWGCSSVSDAGVVCLAELTQLERLELGRCDRVTDRGLEVVAGLSHLGSLGLSGTAVEDAGLAVLSGLRLLRQLNLADTQVTGSGLVALAGLPQLWSLNLSGCVRLHAETLAALRGFAQLTSLNVSGCGLVTDQALIHLRPLRGLAELGLAGLNVTDTGLLYLVDLPTLSTLDLSWTQVGDPGLARLATMRGLHDLTLTGTHVTDAGLVHLRSLPGLEYLDLADTGVSDAGLRVLGSLTTLEVLDLEGVRVHDAGLVHLGTLPHLRRLFLGRTSVTDQGLELLQRISSVRQVDLTMCRNVTQAGVERLEEAGIAVSL